ncbi:putative translation elongation factor eEF-1B gamma subunit [Ascodesmis nigricans]|uniref:Putative translation elongation factor eEF-1B gamma subunit n=1 Tax=Ascodesmis nigricans TaxID=341454 RepID=A0A4S2MQP3_9PEZI|nr:putative translation elongation factor eEF-1B gamma subunit [Ascodesmis nigricans]
MAPFATIYSWPGNPRLKRAIVAANVNGLELSFPPFDMTTARDESFYKKFPLGKVPALETPSGFTLVESGAIAYYISASGPKAPQLLGSSTSPETQAKIQQWLAHVDLEFTTTLLPAIQMAIGRRPEDEAVKKESLDAVERGFKYLEGVLGENRWVAGTQEWSLADVALASFIETSYKLLFGREWRERWGNVLEWYERFVKEEGVKDVWGEITYKE